MKKTPELGALFACKFENSQMQYAFVTNDAIYRLAIDTFDNVHEMLRVKQMRNDPIQVSRYLSGQPPFKLYSSELTHVPGLANFILHGFIQFDKLLKQQTIEVSTSMVLEFIAKIDVDLVNLVEG